MFNETLTLEIQPLVLEKNDFDYKKKPLQIALLQNQNQSMRVPKQGTKFAKYSSSYLIDKKNLSTETLIEKIHSVVLETNPLELEK